jgi:hypothetical protein
MQRTATLVLVTLFVVACGGPPTPTPDVVATEVAQALAVIATLTAEATMETAAPPATPPPTHTHVLPTATSMPPTPTSAEAARGSLQTTTGKLAIEVLAIRAWSPPAQKFELIGEIPPHNYYFWQMDDVPVGTGYVVMDDVGVGESLRVLSTGATFSKEVVELPAPQGRFLEVLLLFENTGNTTLRQAFSSTGSFRSRIGLVLPDGGEVLPVDFLIPSNRDELSRYRELQTRGLTIISTFTGTMQVYLEPGGQTWLVLLFDVPQDSSDAELRMVDAKPIMLRLP